MNKILIIVRREFMTRVAKRSFILLTILMPFIFAALIFLPICLLSLALGLKQKDRIAIAISLVISLVLVIGSVAFAQQVKKYSFDKKHNYQLSPTALHHAHQAGVDFIPVQSAPMSHHMANEADEREDVSCHLCHPS